MRKLSLAVFTLLVCQLLSAQSGRFTIKGGANLFILKASNSKPQDYSDGRVGFVLGAGYEMAINKNFSIQPELNYSYQVAREEYAGSNLKLSYTQVPLLFRYQPTDLKVAFYAGPQVSFLNSAKIKDDDEGEVGVRDQFNQTDFGLAFGIARVPLAPGLTADFRYYRGFMDVMKAEYDNGLKTRPNLFSITVGYIFGTRK